MGAAPGADGPWEGSTAESAVSHLWDFEDKDSTAHGRDSDVRLDAFSTPATTTTAAATAMDGQYSLFSSPSLGGVW